MVKEARRGSDGKYHIQGKKYDMLVGSRAQVMHGTAYKTGYGKKGLKKSQLKMHRGRVVSIKASNRAKSKKNPLAKVFSSFQFSFWFFKSLCFRLFNFFVFFVIYS